MKITFTNIVVRYGGCGCCGDDGSIGSEPGPIVIETNHPDVSIETHAKIAFGEGVVSYDYVVDFEMVK
jgi:hypothetical protein